MSFQFSHPYAINPSFQKRVAYFCMEYGIHQSFKIYAGGLGFLAGSHMRSAYELGQNITGVGILWKYGYYDQVRKGDQTMNVLFEEKIYGFFRETGIKYSININNHDVWVTAYYLPPEIFHTAPLFFLSTDLPENDYLAKTICHRLYDSNPETKIAAAILLGEGGAHLFHYLDWKPEVYHLNESHALPLAFHLYSIEKKLELLKTKLVFTNHTPEEAGNEKTDILLLNKMNYFCEVPLTEVKAITQTEGDTLDHTLTALRLSGVANAVSKKHEEILRRMWSPFKDICELTSITNAQNFKFWADTDMYNALHENNDDALRKRKLACKQILFEEVADQNGELYNENVFTLVFAKRFTSYKRPELLLHNMTRFHKMVSNKERPVQIIWAGKPYPVDYTGIGTFDHIVNICKEYSNCSILAGYEIKLSKMLKGGADAWLNVPRLTHEASGTSGMAAAMNGAVNVSLPDGWFPEFAKDKINSFVISPCDSSMHDHQQDEADAHSLYDLLENEIIPMYYDYPDRWLQIVKNGMKDIIPQFNSNRLAEEYYQQLYLYSSQQ